MASRSRYVKIEFDGDRVTSKNSAVGSMVIGDYNTVDSRRVIVVERPLTATGHRATKPKPKVRVNAKPTSEAGTAFPPAESARG